MELRHLRYFVAVAEELHFGRAAARLRIVQPALSMQVQHLEREVGVMLLDRSRRRVALTPAGRVFLAEARRTLAGADLAVRAARNADAGSEGRLRIGFADLAMWWELPTILRRFIDRFPRVDVILTELHREAQREALLRGDIDVGFLTLDSGERQLEGRLVLRDRLQVALPRGHALATRRRIPLRALAEEPWVLFPSDLRTRFAQLVLASCSSAGFTPRVAQEARQLHSLISLVSGGVGVTLLPSVVARTARSGVVFRPLVGAAPQLLMHVAWRSGETSPVLQRFVEETAKAAG